MSYSKKSGLSPLTPEETQQMELLIQQEMALKRTADAVLAPLNERARELQIEVDATWEKILAQRGVVFSRLDAKSPIYEVQMINGQYEIMIRNYNV